jgi:dTDP-glucose pyrophosphorylase
MTSWKSICVPASMSVADVIKKIDESSLQIALVIDNSFKLLGTVTDGDIRRAILKGIQLGDKVESIMNSTPITVLEGLSRDQILEKMKELQIRHIPVINKSGEVLHLEILENLLKAQVKKNWIVLMAGGLGSRLGTLTENTPKPLLTVGDKPILETIISKLKSYGFERFYISVNYKAEMIRDYFGDGSKWNVQIRYLQEEKRLGTAGGLSLLPEKPEESVLVMNADLLTTLNFEQLLEFHKKQDVNATMCLRDYNFEVPYGVVKIDNHQVASLEEKPVLKFFVNAGIYVLEPEVLSLIPHNDYFDMTDLFEEILKHGYKTAAFPIREYWLDVGRINDLETAQGEFAKLFDHDQK